MKLKLLLILGLVLLLLCNLSSAEGFYINKNPTPVLQKNGTGWEELGVYVPRILKNTDGTTYKDGSNRYWMYYAGLSPTTPGTADATGLAYSTDLTTWTREATNPVLPLGAGIDAGDLVAITVLKDGATWRAWYEANSQFTGSDYVVIGYATSINGISWTKHGAVLTQGPTDDSLDLYSCAVMLDGVTWKMWYTGHNAAGEYNLMYATASNPGGPWTKYSNSYIWENAANYISPSEVWKENGIYYMTYYGHGSPNDISYASSPDGITWTHLGVLLAPSPGTWDSATVYWGSQIKVGDTWYTMYSGHDGTDFSIGYATSNARLPVLWVAEWDYMSTITLNTSVPANDFQIHLTSDDFTIPDRMWEYMNQDGNDTRILHVDNVTVFPVWIEHITTADNFSIWVNVTDNTTGDILNWYYGNDNATSVSDGNTTFIQYHGQTSTSFKMDNVISPPFVLEGRLTQTSATTYDILGVSNTVAANDDAARMGFHPERLCYRVNYNEGAVGEALVAGTYLTDAKYKLVLDGTDVKFYANDVWKNTLATNAPSGDDMGIYYTQGTGDIKWSFIRKYNANDPVVSSIDLSVFQNTPPTTPTATYPTTESTITSAGDINLTVNSTDIDGDTLLYLFYGDMVDGSTYLGQNDSTDGISFNWSVSTYGVYYWKAVAYDGYEYSDTSSVFQFTLLIAPNLTSPLNSSTEYVTYPPLTSSIHFYWQDVAAPKYRLEVAEDVNFNLNVIDTIAGTNNSIQYLLVNNEYFWRIYSYNGAIYSDPSETFSFNLTGNSSVSDNSVHGVVYASIGGVYTALTGAKVIIWNSTYSDSQIVGSNGYYLFSGLATGEIYLLQASKDLYLTSETVYINSTVTPIVKDFFLLPDRTSEEWRHDVSFIVQSIWGTKYKNVNVNAYLNSDVTPALTGVTGSDGSVTFYMNKNQQYRLTFINSSQGISETRVLYPSDSKYYIIVSTTFKSWNTYTVPISEGIDFTISKSIINSSHAYINFTYTDHLGGTTALDVYLNQTNSSDYFNQTNIDSFSGDGNNSHSFIVSNYAGQAYLIHLQATHTTYGTIDSTYSISFSDDIGGKFPGIPPSVWLYGAIFMLLFVGGVWTASNVERGSLVTVVLFFVLYGLGCFATLPAGIRSAMLAGAVLGFIIAVLMNLNKSNKDEGFQ